MRAMLTMTLALSMSLVSLASVATAAEPDPVLVTESDTGMIFGDLDCRNDGHTARAPMFFADDFDYLRAEVRIDTECVTRSGRRVTMRGSDVVLFPTLTFDWADQAWYFGDVLVATRIDRWRTQINPDLVVTLWTDEQESHVSFRVEIRAP